MLLMAFVVILIIAEAILHWSVSAPLLDLPSATHTCMVVEKPRQRGHHWTATVSLSSGQQVRLTAALDSLLPPSAWPNVMPGDRILFHAPIEPPRDTHNPGEMDYGTYLIRHGVTGIAYCSPTSWRLLGASSDMPLTVRMLRWREPLLARFSEHLSGNSLALLCAMTLGDRSHLTSDVRDDFADAGVSHVLALSGLHLSILVMLFSWIVMRWLRRWRYAHVAASLMGIALMAVFVLMAGMPTSLMRAATMLLLAQGCALIERRELGLNNLCLAAFLLLLWQPAWLFDVGFQLSFLAVAGIVVAIRLCPFPERWRRAISNRMNLTAEACERRGRERMMAALAAGMPLERAQRLTVREFMPERPPLIDGMLINLRLWCGALARMVWGMLIVSLGAQIATLPVVAFTFGSIPLYGILLNFVAIPLAFLILVGGVLLLVLPVGHGVVTLCLHWVLTVLMAASSWVADLPGACLDMRWTERHALVIYSRRGAPQVEFSCGGWQGDVLFTAAGRLVRITGGLPGGVPPRPMEVDYLWLCRGARGALSRWLEYYSPSLIVLDGTLSPYYRERYRHEADSLGIAIHDVYRDGALLIEDPPPGPSLEGGE